MCIAVVIIIIILIIIKINISMCVHLIPDTSNSPEGLAMSLPTKPPGARTRRLKAKSCGAGLKANDAGEFMANQAPQHTNNKASLRDNGVSCSHMNLNIISSIHTYIYIDMTSHDKYSLYTRTERTCQKSASSCCYSGLIFKLHKNIAGMALPTASPAALNLGHPI